MHSPPGANRYRPKPEGPARHRSMQASELMRVVSAGRTAGEARLVHQNKLSTVYEDYVRRLWQRPAVLIVLQVVAGNPHGYFDDRNRGFCFTCSVRGIPRRPHNMEEC